MHYPCILSPTFKWHSLSRLSQTPSTLQLGEPLAPWYLCSSLQPYPLSLCPEKPAVGISH